MRANVRSAYDLQSQRIINGGRIVANYKAKLGIKPGQKEKDSDDETKKILKRLRTEYKKITDGIKVVTRETSLKGSLLITSHTELFMLASYCELEKAEQDQFKHIGELLEDYPIYTEFLKDIKGIGPAMAGVIISEIDIHKAKYVSSVWAYCGLDVAENGAGRSMKKEHLRDWEYTDKDGKPAIRKGITFNPFIKSKLIGVLAGSFLKSKNETYTKPYYDYKNRLENHPKHAEKTKGHRNNMALRYMIKIFLTDLYVAWRTIEGLPVAPSYQEGKLGHVHKAA